jgi:stage V sporulation protein D (sporulation-specific penicillin-binding protein)
MNSRQNNKTSKLSKSNARRIRRRYNANSLLVTGIGVLLFAALIAVALFRIQVIDHAEYQAQAAGQHYSRETIYPKRGSIYDRTGTRIAGTKTVYQIGMTPKDARSYRGMADEDDIAKTVSGELNLDLNEFREQMAQTEEQYILLAKDVPEETADRLRTWMSDNSVGGFRFDPESRRVYSNNDLAGQVIGYTRFDEQMLTGALGIELQYNDLLSGVPGYSYAKRDNFQSRGVVPYAATADLAVQNGADLHLTINLEIQRILQETLIETATSMGLTQKVTAIVMDPWDGAILAMGQVPTMRSDDPFAAPATIDEAAWESLGASQVDYLMSNVWRNQNVSDIYEPGSTMKAITTAIAFELSITNENVLYSDDPIELRGHTIRCHIPEGHGIETLAQGFVNSCNPVFVHLGNQIGKERFYEYFRQLGFYERTGVDLPGESGSLIHDRPTDLDFANLTFGESSAVTPLQMLSSYAAIANGGRQVVPHVLSYAEADGVRVREANTALGAPLMSQQTAARVRQLMAAVGQTSLNYTYGSEGYRIGGKTSTATDEVDGGNTYSYMAIAPIESPSIVAMVIIHKPQVEAPSSVVATRPTNRLVSRVLDLLGEKRDFTAADAVRLNRTAVMPNLIGKPLKDAAYSLSAMEIWGYPGDLSMRPDDVVLDQMPAPGTLVAVGSRVYLYPSYGNDVEWVTVPDFTGKTFFECQALAMDAGVVIRAVGNGVAGALSQSPEPTHAGRTEAADQSGAPPAPDTNRMVRRGSVVTVNFSPEVNQTDNAGE